VIKRILFGPRSDGDAWPAALAGILDAPPDARPLRAVVCTALPHLQAGPAHAVTVVEWLADRAHLGRRAAWLAAHGHTPAPGVTVVVAEEQVRRGAAWLEARWADGRPRLKHMAVARRARGLTPAEFSERWRGRAGRVGATPIPEVARGCAYAQNHPLPRPGGDWRYDAVNEVWFDDEDALRTRIAWLDEAVGRGDDDDLVHEASFLAVREELLVTGRLGTGGR
jgi:EthD domain